MINFNKIVNKMLKNCGKIYFKEDIFDIIDPEKKQQNKNYLDKTIYRLKVQNIIIPIKSGVYIIPSKQDNNLNKVDLIDKYYLKLLKKYINYYVGSNYFISGKKSLEFHLKNYEVSQKIYIINRTLNKKIIVGDYQIIFKTISGKNNGKKINLYNFFSNYITKKIVDLIEFKISCLELALLETAVVSDGEFGLEMMLLSKTIKKYSKVFNNDIFYSIAKYKYIMSFNRLKEISRTLDKDLSDIFLDIIKKNGGLFIGEGLRGF